jgi:hypothetical protein
MKIHPVHPPISPVAQAKFGGASTGNEDQEGEVQQSSESTSSPAYLKKDPARLPEKAQQAPAHVARALIAAQAQAESSEAEQTTNFGQYVAKVAKGELPAEIEPPQESEGDEEI